MSANIKPKVTFLLYLVIVFSYLFCHIDLGILAVSNDAIIKTLDINESGMGLLATGLYVGNVAGSLLCPFLFSKLKAKHILVTAAVLNAAFVAVFTFVTDYWIIFGSRVAVGFFQVMFIIYFPVWIDQQAPPRSQTMWISFFFLTVPIGLIVGYGSTAVFFSGGDNWKWAFLIQTALMIVPSTVLMVSFPAKYYEKPKLDGNSSQTQGLIEATHQSIDGLKKTLNEYKNVRATHKTFSIIEK